MIYVCMIYMIYIYMHEDVKHCQTSTNLVHLDLVPAPGHRDHKPAVCMASPRIPRKLRHDLVNDVNGHLRYLDWLDI